jgi:hypothetical protein
MRRAMTILLTAVLGPNLLMPMAVARDSGKIGFGHHTNYYGSAFRRQPMHNPGKSWRGTGYHASDPPCLGESSKYPPWSFC